MFDCQVKQPVDLMKKLIDICQTDYNGV